MRTGTWTELKAALKGWDAAQLTALIKDLHALSAENRTFLSARVLEEGGDSASIEPYRKRIADQFFPKRGYGKLKLGEARKAIREYKKASGNVEGTIDLMLSYLENGNAFTLEYGDINGPFYDSLCSMMDELAALLKTEGPAAYAKVRERLDDLATDASGLGWGYGDHINDAFAELEEEFN